MNNHLRQFHGLKTKEEVQKAMGFLRPALETFRDEVLHETLSSSEDSSSSEEDGLLENCFERAIHKDSNFLASESDSEDEDWLSLQYLNRRLENKEKTKLNVNHNRSEKVTSGSESEGSSVDFDDGEEKFYMASNEEESFLEEFVVWMQSPDGGIKPYRTALKHKNVIMGVLFDMPRMMISITTQLASP